MPTKQSQNAEVNRFVKGLITEASPLNFPEDATVAEDNFVLNKDGTRDRRLGMDFEENYAYNDAGYTASVIATTAVNTFVWENVGEDPDTTFAVVQIGSTLYFHAQANAALSSAQAGSVAVGTRRTDTFSFAVVDGDLVVATGDREITIVQYDSSAGTFSTSTITLKVRDTFGLDDLDGTTDITEGVNIGVRPTTLTDPHLYNLRNQSWGVPRDVKGHSYDDCIYAAQQQAGDYPSNADIQHEFVRPDPSSEETPEKFFGTDYEDNPPYTFPAARGYFVIDALLRGTSRVEALDANAAKSPELTLHPDPANIPEDTTPGGATQVAEFAGRIWYAGFSGEVVGGDTKSPRLSSYVMFSQLVEKPSDIAKCYQAGDPTSPASSDIVATDGGFIRVSGAERIIRLVALDDVLFIIATNGVWRVGGGADEGFSAENFIVAKVAEHGAVSRESVVPVVDGLAYWSEDGIYQVSLNDVSKWTATNITQETIQTHYNAISTASKESAKGIFDNFTRKVRWLYESDQIINNRNLPRELVLDTNLGAFYPTTIGALASGATPDVVAYMEAEPFTITVEQTAVTVGGVVVTDSGDDTYLAEDVRASGLRSTKYLTIHDPGLGNVRYTFSSYRDQDFLDWKTVNTVGVDAPAYLLTGEVIAGDSTRVKQVPWLTFHMVQTEEVLGADYELTHPSSCLVRTQWDFSNSVNSGRWSRDLQMYRLRRHYVPAGVGFDFDNGYSVVTTKNKLRGRGRSFSMYMQTEAGKDCRILGWGLSLNGNGIV